jgi:hypothetical protein
MQPAGDNGNSALQSQFFFMKIGHQDRRAVACRVVLETDVRFKQVWKGSEGCRYVAAQPAGDETVR